MVEDKRQIEQTKRLYIQGKLTPEEAEEFEVYFLDKPELVEQIELEMALQQHMPAVSLAPIKDDVKEQSEQMDNINSRWLTKALQPMLASAATFIICLVSFSWYWQGSEQGQTPEFTGSGKVNLVYVAPVRSGVTSPEASLSLTDSDEQVTIVLQPSNTVATEFDISMISPNGKVMREFSQVSMQGMGDLVIAVPMAQFNQGDWIFEIKAIGDSDDVERLVLTVTD